MYAYYNAIIKLFSLVLSGKEGMPAKIEDYALIGDCATAALVTRDGCIDWLCFPRFESPACFAALLGTEDHGRWRIMPAGRIRKLRRCYRDSTLILETDFSRRLFLLTFTCNVSFRHGPVSARG